MMSYRRFGFRGKWLLFSVFLTLIILAGGCTIAGKPVPADKRIVFDDGQNTEGRFTSGRFSLHYSYKVQGDRLAIRGDFEYGWSYDLLDVRLLFLADDGTIIKRVLVYSSGFRSTGGKEMKKSFKKELEIPPATGGISFSHHTKDRLHHS